MENMGKGWGRMNASPTEIIQSIVVRTLSSTAGKRNFCCGLIQNDISVWFCSHSEEWSQKCRWTYRM